MKCEQKRSSALASPLGEYKTGGGSQERRYNMYQRQEARKNRVLGKVQGSVDSLLRKQQKNRPTDRVNQDPYDPFRTTAREKANILFSNDYAEEIMLPSPNEITKLMSSTASKYSKLSNIMSPLKAKKQSSKLVKIHRSTQPSVTRDYIKIQEDRSERPVAARTKEIISLGLGQNKNSMALINNHQLDTEFSPRTRQSQSLVESDQKARLPAIQQQNEISLGDFNLAVQIQQSSEISLKDSQFNGLPLVNGSASASMSYTNSVHKIEQANDSSMSKAAKSSPEFKTTPNMMSTISPIPGCNTVETPTEFAIKELQKSPEEGAQKKTQEQKKQVQFSDTMQRFEQLKDDVINAKHHTKAQGHSQRPQITPKKPHPSIVCVNQSLSTHRKSENFEGKRSRHIDPQLLEKNSSVIKPQSHARHHTYIPHSDLSSRNMHLRQGVRREQQVYLPSTDKCQTHPRHIKHSPLCFTDDDADSSIRETTMVPVITKQGGGGNHGKTLRINENGEDFMINEETDECATPLDGMAKASLPQIQQNLISPRPKESSKKREHLCEDLTVPDATGSPRQNRGVFQDLGSLTSAGRYASNKVGGSGTTTSAQKPATAFKQQYGTTHHVATVATAEPKPRRDLTQVVGTSTREDNSKGGNNLFMGTTTAQLTQRYKSSVKSRTANYQKFLSALPQAGMYLPNSVHTQAVQQMNATDPEQLTGKRMPQTSKGPQQSQDKNNKLKIKVMANRQNKLDNVNLDPYQADHETRPGAVTRALGPPGKSSKPVVVPEPPRGVYSQMRMTDAQKHPPGFKPILKNRVTISQGRQNSSLAVRNSSIHNQQKSHDGTAKDSQTSSLRRISTTSVGAKIIAGAPYHQPLTSHGKVKRVGQQIINTRDTKDNSLYQPDLDIDITHSKTTTAAGLPALARKSSNQIPKKNNGIIQHSPAMHGTVQPLKITIKQSTRDIQQKSSIGTKTTNTNTEDSTESNQKAQLAGIAHRTSEEVVPEEQYVGGNKGSRSLQETKNNPQMNTQVRPLRIKKTQLEPLQPNTTKQQTTTLPRSRSKMNPGVNRTASQANSVKNNTVGSVSTDRVNNQGTHNSVVQKSVDMTRVDKMYVTENIHHEDKQPVSSGNSAIGSQRHQTSPRINQTNNLRSHSLVSQQPASPRNEGLTAAAKQANKMASSTNTGDKITKKVNQNESNLSKSRKPDKNGSGLQGTSKTRTQNNSVNFVQTQPHQPQEEDKGERIRFEAFVHHIQKRRRDAQQEQPLVIKDFKLGLQIGAGAFAVVKRAVHNNTKYTVAIKTYEKKNLTDKEAAEAVHREINTLSDLYHPHIMTLFEVIDQRTHVHLVMEQCMGASLYHHIKKLPNQRMPEDLCRVVIRQIVSGISYMHQRGYAHRDLKLDNILFEQKTKTAKIIDFGFSIKVADEPKQGKLNIFCGTPHYMDPDLVKKQAYSGPAADVWASGVILYILLVGKLPFFGEFEADLFRKIQSGKFRPLPADVGNQRLRNLFKRIFEVNAATRITAEQLLTGDNWINSE